ESDSVMPAMSKMKRRKLANSPSLIERCCTSASGDGFGGGQVRQAFERQHLFHVQQDHELAVRREGAVPAIGDALHCPSILFTRAMSGPYWAAGASLTNRSRYGRASSRRPALSSSVPRL